MIATCASDAESWAAAAMFVAFLALVGFICWVASR